MSEPKFQVGQEVVWERNGNIFGDRMLITKIIGITPRLGYFKIAGCGYRFDTEGRQAGGGWLRDCIFPVTDELRDSIAHTNLSRRLNEHNFAKYPLEVLREIAKFVGEKEKELYK